MNDLVKELRLAAEVADHGYTYYLSHGGKPDPKEERWIEALNVGADAIERVADLKSRLAQVERERDAAVADITGILETSDCEVRHVYCSRSTPPFECNADECKGYAKWRGICSENTKEEK